MLVNDLNIGAMSDLVSFYTRSQGLGTIAGIQTLSAHTSIRAEIRVNDAWKYAKDKVDINKIIVMRSRYYADIKIDTMVRYKGIDYRVTSIKIIGRRQGLEIAAIEDQS
jgi:hypothetical protein